MTDYKKDDVLSETVKLRPAAEPPVQVVPISREQLAQILANMNQEADLTPPPQPTLESIRDEISSWKSQYAGQLTELNEDRFNLSTKTCSIGLMAALHSGNMKPILDWAKRGNIGLPDDVAQELSGQEWVELTLARQWENVAVVCSLGVLVGKMLADSSFTTDEVMRLAADPVFTLNVVTGRVTRKQVRSIAWECLDALYKLDAEASPESEKNPAGE